MSASSWKAGRLEGWKEGTRAAAALEKAEAASGLDWPERLEAHTGRSDEGCCCHRSTTCARRYWRGEAQDTWQAASTLRKDIKNKKKDKNRSALGR